MKSYKMEIGSIVKITHFDDGNQDLKNTLNVWRVVGFKFNKSKSLITSVHSDSDGLENRRSISTWKLQTTNDFKMPE